MELKQIEEELKRAFNGLLMRSETDEPFEFYYDEENTADKLNEDTVRKLAGMPAEYPLEVVEVDYFFRNMTKVNPENGTEGEQQAQRFRQLQEKLQELLQDVKVYKVGEDRISVLILGKTPNGEIAGIKTVVVET
ncbi:nuclease A inhibitor family protein [Pontibacter roseus]|uniref:nuclease A inhibitor family protein n=1 Tax=Pontibacter roseus TaxID=336989 RepID=UPI000368F70D|nr:nuclease A inhibitor family protein [Pontibacter roseus]